MLPVQHEEVSNDQMKCWYSCYYSSYVRAASYNLWPALMVTLPLSTSHHCYLTFAKFCLINHLFLIIDLLGLPPLPNPLLCSFSTHTNRLVSFQYIQSHYLWFSKAMMWTLENEHNLSWFKCFDWLCTLLNSRPSIWYTICSKSNIDYTQWQSHNKYYSNGTVALWFNIPKIMYNVCTGYFDGYLLYTLNLVCTLLR